MALPPGPRSPTLAQTFAWMRRPISLLERCLQRYGDFFTLRVLPMGNIAVVSHPDAIKQVFTGDQSVFHAGEPARPILGPLVGNHSLLTLDGKPHLRQRRLMLPPFHGERMVAYAQAMYTTTLRHIEKWPLHQPFDVSDRLRNVALEVIIRTVFGVEDADRMRLLGDKLSTMLELGRHPSIVMSMLPFSVGVRAKFDRQLKTVDALIYEQIEHRRQAGANSPDVLSLMLSAVDDDGVAMTDEEIRDELVTLLVAGHETTATSLAWTLERLLSHRDTYIQAVDEARSVMSDGAPSDAVVRGLVYIDAAIKESLRLRPVIPMVARKLQQPLLLQGFNLPVGTIVAPSIYLVQRRADIYPDPTRFDPSRFIDTKPNPYSWLPFGGSIRRCLGMAFAMYEMKIVLATILREVDLGLAPGTSSRMARRSITFAPSGGPMLTARRPS